MKLLYYLRTLFKCFLFFFKKKALATWKCLDMSGIMNKTGKHARNKPLWSYPSLPRIAIEGMISIVRSGLMEVMISPLKSLKHSDDCIPGGCCKKYFLGMTKKKKSVFCFNKPRALNMLGKISNSEVSPQPWEHKGMFSSSWCYY